MVKKKHALALFPLALCFSSVEVLAAATTADLEHRMQEQDKKILRLENQLKGTRAAVKEDRSRINQMQERLKINGFMSAGVATNDGDDAVDSFYGIGDEYSTAAISKLGIQMTFAVSEDFSATAQLVSKGTNDYEVTAEWAYLTYEATNNLRFNLGRQRIPYYLLSEYLDVGYALPWVVPPIELYNIPISAVDGISAIYNFSLGEMNFTWQTYGGAGIGYSEQLEADFTQNNSWGTSLTAEVGSWTFRMGYTGSSLDAEPVPGGSGDQLISAMETAENTLVPTLNAQGFNLPVERPESGYSNNLSTDYISAGFMYDNGSLLVLGEIANLSADDTIQPVGDAGYLTIGYRFGKWMPHITYAKFQTDAKNDKQIRQLQAYVDAVGKAAYQAALIQNGNTVPANPARQSVNELVTATVPGPMPPAGTYPLASVGVTGNQVVSSTACAGTAITCSGDALALMGMRDALLEAASGYSQDLYNSFESQIQEQQSITLGLTYDVNSRVKAKAQITHYEGFGENNYQSLNSSSVGVLGGALPATQYTGFTTTNIDGNGRFIGEPGAVGNHTAIYSLSIDAVF